MAKLYTKNTWVDEVLAGDARYNILEDGGTPIEEKAQIVLDTTVTQAGTAVDADLMNNIENGIDTLDNVLDNPNLTEKTTVIDADNILLYDSEASNAPKRASISSITYLDPIQIVIGNGEEVINTGYHGHIEIGVDCTITAARLVADASGSIVIDIWKDSYANLLPTDADSIVASAPPTLSSVLKSEDTTLTGWTKDLSKGDWLAFNVDSATTVKQITLSLSRIRRIAP